MTIPKHSSTSKGEQTRQLLVESAYKLFLQKGYHGTSMRHIAKEAGLALGGIYNHFAGKEEMFQAVILAHHPFLKIFPKFEEIASHALDKTGEPLSAEDLIRQLTHLIFAEFKKEPQLLNLMFIELVELDGANLAKLFPVLQPTIFAFLQRVTLLQPEWRIPNPIIFIRSYIGLIIGIYITDRFVPQVAEAADSIGELDDFLEIYLHGLFKN